MRIRNACDKITCLSLYFISKKEHYMRLGVSDKVRCIASSMEELLQEIPWLMERTGELIQFVEDEICNQDMRYNFCFFLAVEKFAFILSNFRENSSGVQNLMAELSSFVQREEFDAALVELGLLHPSFVRSEDGESVANSHPCCSSEAAGVKNRPKQKFADYGAPQLDLVSLVYHPPPRCRSKSAAKMQELFESGHLADMEFLIASPQASAPSVSEENGTDSAGGLGAMTMDLESAEEDSSHGASASSNTFVTIKAHRVVVASRCDWFRRALTSGMQEDITRKIVVHDVSPPVFRTFLEYLYAGTLTQNEHNYLANADNEQWTCDQWAEMLLLSDRYEVEELNTACEAILKRFLNNDCALFLLSIADQCNACTLKSQCLAYIGKHPSIRDSEDFYKLRQELRAEVDQVIRRAGRCSLSSHRAQSRRHEAHGGLNGLEAMTQTLSISGSRSRHRRQDRRSRSRRHKVENDSDVLERMPLVANDDDDDEQEDETTRRRGSFNNVPRDEGRRVVVAGAASADDPRMELSLAELRDVLGEEASVETLKEVLLAADFDLNRALNYFFANDHHYR